MAFDKKEGQGTIFPNSKKQNPNHSDWQGDIKLNGQEYWVNAWNKQSRNGGKYISLSMKLKNRQPKQEQDPPVQYGGRRQKDDMDDGIPF